MFLDVSIKVGELWIPGDFVMINMEEDEHIPIIFGRLFLATCGAMIDVKNEKISLNVRNDKMVYNMSKPFDFSSNFNLVYIIESTEEHSPDEEQLSQPNEEPSPQPCKTQPLQTEEPMTEDDRELEIEIRKFFKEKQMQKVEKDQ